MRTAGFDIIYQKTKFGVTIMFNKKATFYANEIDYTYPQPDGTCFIPSTKEGYLYVVENCPSDLKCKPWRD